MVALALARDVHPAFSHVDIDGYDFCRANASAVVSCDAGCAFVHKPMKYDPGALVVGVGRGESAGAPLRRALAALKVYDSNPACGSLGARPGTCRVLVGPRWADKFADLLPRYPRAKYVLATSDADACAAEVAHNRRVRRLVPAAALFELDLRRGAEDPTHWRDFCAFLEAWSSCKTDDLARIAKAWQRLHPPEDCAAKPARAPGA